MSPSGRLRAETFCHTWMLPVPRGLHLPKTRNTLLKRFCVSEKLSVPKFQSILPPKMCPGSRRKWVRVCAIPCFSEHGHYRRSTETKRETQTNQEVRLGCFVWDYCFTPWSFLFLLLCLILPVSPLLLLSSFILLSHFLHLLSYSHLHSPASIRVYLMIGEVVQKTDNKIVFGWSI